MAKKKKKKKKKKGRKSPCPCGSGKKYKKCCLDKAHTLPAAAPVARQSFPSAVPTTGEITSYKRAKLFEKSDQFAEMKRREPAKARLYWTTSRVKALATEELVERLKSLGIDASRERFVALAEKRWSAWGLSDIWRGAMVATFWTCSRPLLDRHHHLSRHDNDFIGLAACELWARYCPQRPSMEMLDDWMQEGYELSRQRQGPQACDLWAKVWAVIAERLRPQMCTCNGAAEIFDGVECLFNWIQDYQLELSHAALDDEEYARAGVTFSEAVLTQFPAELGSFRLSFRSDLGSLYILAGRPEQGERVFLDLIDEHPDKCAGYVDLVEVLASGARDGPIDRARVLELIEQARAKPVRR